MNRRFRITVALAAIAFGLTSLAALAVTPVNIVPAKIKVRGNASAPVAGKGSVIVQVLVHPDGSHHVMRVIHSTNPGDNLAAMQIAQSSTYAPATRNGKPTIWFYDYTLRFTSGGITTDVGARGVSPIVLQLEQMIRAGNYTGAKARATDYLAAHPDDSKVRMQLAVADFYAGDTTGAAAAFAHAGPLDPRYKEVAAHAYGASAFSLAGTDPTTALAYAQQAVQLDPGGYSQFALGVAQLANKDSASAVVSLSKARQLAFADKGTTTKGKLSVDTELLQAYAAQNDDAGVNTISAEILQLDPTSTLPARIKGAKYLTLAFADLQANNTPDALTNFDLAAQNGDSEVQVTAYSNAALALADEKSPDYTKVQAYADRALAINPNFALANYAEGVAFAGQWEAGGGKDKAKKQAAIDACTKAEQQAAAANQNTLVTQIQAFVKSLH